MTQFERTPAQTPTPTSAERVAPEHKVMPTPVSSTLQGKHILAVKDFTREQLHHLFNLAHNYRVAVNKERQLDHILKVCSCIEIS